MTTLSPTVRLDAPAARASIWPITYMRYVVLFAICFVIAVASRLSYLAEPWSSDGAMFVALGKLTANGQVIGRDWIDNKLPTVGLVTKFFWLAFGTSWWMYVVAQLTMSLLATWRITVIARRIWGEYARIPALLVSLTLLNLNSVVFGGFQLETIQVLFAVLAAESAMYSLRSRSIRDALLVGVFAGIASLCKPTGGAVLAAFVFVLLARRQLRDAFTALIGFTIVAVIAVIAMWSNGSLAYFPILWNQTARYAANTAWVWSDLSRPGILLLLFVGALLVRGWVRRRPEHRVRTLLENADPVAQRPVWVGSFSPQLFVIVWLMIEFVGVLMQKRMYAYHFLPLIPPAALCFAMIPRRVNLGELYGVLLLPLVLSAWGSVETMTAAGAKHQPVEMAEFLNRHARAGDSVWRDHLQQVVVQTELQPASRMPMSFLFMNYDQAGGEFGAMLLNDLRRKPPRFLVLPADVGAYIAENVSGVDQLQRRPERARQFAGAWRAIEDFAHSQPYRAISKIGRETVYERIVTTDVDAGR